MRPTHGHLPRLERISTRRLSILKQLVGNKRPPCSSTDDQKLAFAAIEAMTVWSTFVRSYYLSCALGATRSGGTRITISQSGISSSEDAIRFAVQKLKPRLGDKANLQPLDEPTWRAPSTLIRLAQQIGFSHRADVAAAFGVPSSVFAELHHFRNFYAHRGEYTFAKIQGIVSTWGFPRRMHPSAAMAHCRPGRPQNTISDWLDEIRMVIEVLCL